MKRLLSTLTTAALLMGTSALAETNLKLVEVITSPERTQMLQQLVDDYEAANPGVNVEIVSLPWGQAFEKFATMVAGGDIPDVVEMPDRWLALYAGAGKLASLEDHIKGWDHGATLTDKTLAMGRQNDNTAYMLPYGFYLRAMFYNKKLLAEAGVDEPPRTMEEFMEASAKVSALPGKSGYCLRGGPGGLNGWIMMAATMNGTNEFFNAEGQSRLQRARIGRRASQFLIDMYQEGLCTEGHRQLGLQRDRRGLLFRHLRLSRSGPRRADRHRRADASRGFRGDPDAGRPSRQGLPDHRFRRLVDVRRHPAQGRRLEAGGASVAARTPTRSGPSGSA